MKKAYVLMVLTAACMVFAGCGAKEKEAQQPVQQITGEETQSGQEAPAKEEGTESEGQNTSDLNRKNDEVQEAEPTEQTDEEWLAEMEAYESQHAEETAKRREAYIKVLSDILDHYVWSDGSEVVFNDDLSLNHYSIADIDGDEKEELVIYFGTAPMAWMKEVIYDYDIETGELRTQLQEFPGIILYSNGVIRANSSHNQTDSDFWPFMLYCYDPEEDIYAPVGEVVAWDKEISPNGFPDDVDADGNGRVYAISDGTEYPQDFVLDDADYEAWYAGWLNEGATEIELLWNSLDKANLTE